MTFTYRHQISAPLLLLLERVRVKRVENRNLNGKKSLSQATLIFLGLACWSVASMAEPPKQNPAAAQALTKAQGMLRQLSQEKVSLEAEKAALTERVKQLELDAGKLAALQQEVERYKAGLSSAQNVGVALQNQLSNAAEKEQALHKKLQETVAQAQLIQKDNQLLVAAIKEREQWIKQCGDKNQALSVVNQEFLHNFQNKDFWDKLVENEPLTGLGNVKTETAVEEYQFKLEELKTIPYSESGNRDPAEK